MANIQVISQYVEETSFQWLLRDDAIGAPHYALDDLSTLDDRVEAHLDGLRVAGAEGWALCLEALNHEEPGEVFAAGVLALESQDKAKIEAVLATVTAAPETLPGFVSACGWVEPTLLADTVFPLIDADEPLFRRIGVAARAVHRIDPGPVLAPRIGDDEARVRARALKAVGELGRVDLWGYCDAHGRADDDPLCRFWADWSAVRVGDRAGALQRLYTTTLTPSAVQVRAVATVGRALAVEHCQTWFTALAANPDNRRALITAVGAVGLPFHIPWLIEQMAVPELARVAGEAVSLITGLDLAYEDLETDEPAGFEAGPTEDPEDDNVDLDPDEDLPWPDPALLTAWWAGNRSRFVENRRHLGGAPVSPEQCRHVLIHGFQRQRIAAALEDSLMRPDQPVFETRAPGFRQQLWLGVKRRR